MLAINNNVNKIACQPRKSCIKICYPKSVQVRKLQTEAKGKK